MTKNKADITRKPRCRTATAHCSLFLPKHNDFSIANILHSPHRCSYECLSNLVRLVTTRCCVLYTEPVFRAQYFGLFPLEYRSIKLQSAESRKPRLIGHENIVEVFPRMRPRYLNVIDGRRLAVAIPRSACCVIASRGEMKKHSNKRHAINLTGCSL